MNFPSDLILIIIQKTDNMGFHIGIFFKFPTDSLTTVAGANDNHSSADLPQFSAENFLQCKTDGCQAHISGKFLKTQPGKHPNTCKANYSKTPVNDEHGSGKMLEPRCK